MRTAVEGHVGKLREVFAGMPEVTLSPVGSAPVYVEVRIGVWSEVTGVLCVEALATYTPTGAKVRGRHQVQWLEHVGHETAARALIASLYDRARRTAGESRTDGG